MSTLIHFVNSATEHMLVLEEMERTLVNSGSYISEASPWRDRNLASFYVRPGLANSSIYSFESKMLPGYFLRTDDDGGVYLVEQESDTEFKEDATFSEQDGALVPVSDPSLGITLSDEGVAITMDLDDPEFLPISFSQAEKKWKDSYTISFNYFGDKSVHLTLENDEVGFRSYPFWEDFDDQSNSAGWYLDYNDNNTPYFTIKNVSDDQERFLAVAADNRSVELVENGLDGEVLSNSVLWRAEALSSRGQYVIVNRKLEKDGKNALRVNREYVDDEGNINNSLSVVQYDTLSDVSVVLNIDERFIPTRLDARDVEVANSLLRRSNGLTSLGMIFPLSDYGGENSWSVRRYKTEIGESKNDETYKFVAHIGVDPLVSKDAEEWLMLEEQILNLPIMSEFEENEQTRIINIAQKHLSRAYRSHVEGKSSAKFTSGIIWLKPDLPSTKILDQVDTFIDYDGQTLRTVTSIAGQEIFSAAFGFLLEKEERDGTISYILGDPTSGETREPD